MKTIEERAKEYAPDPFDPDYILPAREGHIVNQQRIAYIAGATEQKAIDDAILLKLDSLWEENDARHNHEDEMHYKQGYFICPVCRAKSKEALHETLLQYRILVSPRISNKAFREFFNIHCIHIASKLLAKAGLEKHGANKGTYYIIPEKFE